MVQTHILDMFDLDLKDTTFGQYNDTLLSHGQHIV